jgi:hypothetical protein
MSDNYIIEVRPSSSGVTFPAGIVVRDGRSFKFFAASQVFSPLEGQRFDSPRTAEQAALRRIAEMTSRKPANAGATPPRSSWDQTAGGQDAWGAP